MKNLKIDKFYIIFGSVLVSLAVLVIIVLQTVFSAITTASAVSDELSQSTTPRINRSALETALEKVEAKKIDSLDLDI